VAYNASLAAIRLLNVPPGQIYDDEEKRAMLFRKNEIDIYNNSWGPGRQQEVRFAGPGSLMRQGLAKGTEEGRNGRGSLFIWSAGNSAEIGDNSNYDGYANSPYTIAVGAVGANGKAASYSEPGANVWLSAPSQGDIGPGIFTTARRVGDDPTRYFQRNFGGTSAAAPIVSGVAALLLEARPELSWRDVRAILAMTSTRVDPDHEDWQKNGLGLWVNHQFGHGMVNAEAALNLARIWPLLPPLVKRATSNSTVGLNLLINQTLTGSISVSNNLTVETVQVMLTSNYSNWGDLEVILVSPSGTASVLAEPQFTSQSYPSGGQWTFSSVRHFGEPAAGTWQLQVTKRKGASVGSFNSWSLEFHGYPSPDRLLASGNTISESIVPDNNEVVIDFNDWLDSSSNEEWQLLSVKDPAHGNLINMINGQYRYQMNSVPVEEDWIHWVVGHPSGIALDGVLRIVNTQNIPIPDFAVAGINQSVDIPVLENDFQAAEVPLTLGDFEQPRSGTVTEVGRGVLRYQPAIGFSGVDRFSYQLASNLDSEAPGWVTIVVSEEADWALGFNGQDSEIVFSPAAAPSFEGNFTLEAWIFPRGWGEFSTGFGRIFDKAKIAFFLNSEDHAFYNDESLILYLEGATAESNFAASSAANSIRLNEWQHVAVTFNAASSNQAQFYVNGTLVASDRPLANQGSLLNHGNEALYIGEAANGQRAFEGLMADMRIWNHARSSGEIIEYMDRSLSGQETGLVFHLPMTEGSGSVIRNQAGNASATGTISRAHWTTRSAPSLEVRRQFSIYQDDPSGWLRDRSLGWIYPDQYPWLYLERFEWSRILPAGVGSYWINAVDDPKGWLYWNTEYRPWVMSAETGEWEYQP
jgi:subtilisin-like proprotein convertase family protein